MRSAAPAVLLALAACSPAPQTPAANDALDANVTTPVANVASVASAGSALSGQVSGLNAAVSDLQIRMTETQTIVDLPADTLFAFDSADLDTDAAANLLKLADLVRQAPAGEIQVTGHTDAKGEDAYNLALSERRAQSVANWLREQPGLRERGYAVAGKGEAEPVAPNARPGGADDPEGRARNRRVSVAMPR